VGELVIGVNLRDVREIESRVQKRRNVAGMTVKLIRDQVIVRDCAAVIERYPWVPKKTNKQTNKQTFSCHFFI
jgi:hypothetical protein